MPLLRLELCDFKSYRGHQVIDLGPSFFTCVIGPNGSGKSNLMDAVSFVLGVKSSQLRSTSVKDLIYRGRKARNDGEGAEESEGGGSSPQRLGKRKARGDAEDGDEEQADDGSEPRTAWVAAIYQDTKGRVWRYKRSVTAAATEGANATSSYSIDDRSVTYLAYAQSLESHQILVKAKNFLVFQGDVEQVASQSPQDLSRLIDQISGSAELAQEYERCRLAQEKAIELSSLNFSRKRGIASELKHFRDQKGEVERWEQMREERDELVIKHLLWKLWHIERGIETSREGIEERKASLSDLQDKQGEAAAEVDQAKKQHAQARTVVAKQEAKVKSADKALDEKRPELLALETKIEHDKNKIAMAARLAREVERDEARQAASVADLEQKLAEAEQAADEAAEAQRKARAKNGGVMALAPADLEEYRKLKAAAGLQAVEERRELDRLRSELKTARAALVDVNERADAAEQRRVKLETDASALKERLETLKEDEAQLRSSRDRARRKVNELQTERNRINDLERKANDDLQEVYTRLLQAKADKRESDRETKLRSTLQDLKRVFNGVHGRVVDLCRPTQEKYNAAVQVVLGRNLDSIVVETESVAINCIEYMRDQRAGQATFIPLDTIQLKPVNDRLRSVTKGARLAIDVIQYDPSVERAMQHACGSSIVCDTMDIARFVCYEKGHEVKAVTLDGTVLHKSGLITGGQGSGQGRKFDQREVEGWERRRDALMKQLKDLADQKPKTSEEDPLLAEIRKADAKLALNKEDLSGVESRLKGFQDEIKVVKDSLKKLLPEREKRNKDIAAKQEEMDAIAQIVDSADDEIFKAFCGRIRVANIREYEEVQLRLAQSESEARVKFDTQIARLKTSIRFEERQLANTRERLQRLRTAIEHDTQSVETTLAERKTDLETEIQEMEELLETLREKLAEAQDNSTSSATAVDLARKAYNRAVRDVDAAQKEISTFSDQITKLASERFHLYRKCKLEDVELPLRKGNLAKVPVDENLEGQTLDDQDSVRIAQVNDFGIEVDFDDMDAEDQDNDDAAVGVDYEERIQAISEDIEKMSPNLKAMDKLGDVEQRLRQTERESGQAKNDTRKAREEFQAVRKKRCDLYNKAFNHIAAEIVNVYKDLTKGRAAPQGGVAYLTVEDSEEPYLSGVKYHAMPPMKRFRDMEQLSGGEKTMAALALLFAIHSYQPSPFFVLDEVDAALDNTNVGRLASYLREKASKTCQFIVISLKSSLYERSNCLVGVHRDQDVNSSKSLTLDLQKYDE